MKKREIIVNNICVKGNRVEYFFSVSDSLKKYFDLEDLCFIEYEFDLENIPKSVLVVPFLGMILPLSWVLDVEIKCEEVDKDFYYSIPKFKRGYINMYPHIDFLGNIVVDKVVDNRLQNENNEKIYNAATFFSGGVDATATLIRHIDEKPILITIYGADIRLEDEEGWKQVKLHLQDIKQELGMTASCVKSTFRKTIAEGELTQYVREKDDRLEWWHEFQHGIAIIAHAAPITCYYGIEKVYIASSYTAEHKNVWCASDPTIDNFVRFCGAEVEHDGYEWNRQEKINSIIQYKSKNKCKINLRVCWQSSGGKNCCTCEKCYRTITSLIIKGENPEEYGLSFRKENFAEIVSLLKSIEKVPLDWKAILVEARKENASEIEQLEMIHFGAWKQIGGYLHNPEFYNNEESQIRVQTLYERLREIYFCFLRKKEKDKIKNKCKKAYLEKGKRKKIILANTPTHGNYGDHAIALAEEKFLKHYFPEQEVMEITDIQLRENFEIWKDLISESDVLMIHGGGYLGDIWINEEKMVRKILDSFPNQEIFILPQTIYYGDRKEIEESRKFYYKHKSKLTVFLRDQKSYSIFSKDFAEITEVHLVPDMVNYIECSIEKKERKGVLLCLRSDKERIIDDKVLSNVIEWMAEKNYFYKLTDTCSNQHIMPEDRKIMLEEKWGEFFEAEFVVTDRLHGMLFAAITGTPCIALNNISQKVKGGYEWIKELPYIIMCDEQDDIVDKLNLLRSLCENTYQYNNKRLKVYFDKMADVIAARKEE